jgi:hypothetical protein
VPLSNFTGMLSISIWPLLSEPGIPAENETPATFGSASSRRMTSLRNCVARRVYSESSSRAPASFCSRFTDSSAIRISSAGKP